MADLDNDLSRRLSRLAAAVPTARLDPAHLRAVEARHHVRMAWMTPLVALVVVVVGATLLGGGDRPNASSEPSAATSDGQVVQTTRSGDFELTIRAGQARYVAGESIDISATLTYLGQDPVVIHHASGASVPGRGSVDGPDTGGEGGPIGFGIVEPVLGDLVVGTGWDLSCGQSTLEPGEELAVPFQKGGGWSSNHPRAAEYRAYLEDPDLRLATGTWHIYAVAEFSIGDCGTEPIKMRIEIPIEVALGPAPTGAPAGAGPANVDRDGAFSLELRAGKARYAPDEAIEVVGTLLFDGPDASIEFRHDSSGPIMFGIREPVFGEIDVGTISMLRGRTTLQRSVPYTSSFAKGGGLMGDHPDTAMHMAWMEDPVLRLAEGTWHLYAMADGSPLDPTSQSASFSLSAEIEIVVDDDPDATPGHPEATEYPNRPVYGGADIGFMALQLKSERPVYEVGEPIELSVWYWFMHGPEVVASHFEPEVKLSIERLDATETESKAVPYDSACTDLGLVTGKERHVEVRPGLITMFRADVLPTTFDALFVDGKLRLPFGYWRISASVTGEFGPCSEGGEPYTISTSLEIVVVENPD